MMNNGEPKSYTLANLRKYTKYDFFLVPFFKTVEGQPSNSMVVQTHEDGMSRHAHSVSNLLSYVF